MHFEKAAVLFNLASVLTQQALNADRTTDAGRKEAARKFQVRRLRRQHECPSSGLMGIAAGKRRGWKLMVKYKRSQLCGGSASNTAGGQHEDLGTAALQGQGKGQLLPGTGTCNVKWSADHWRCQACISRRSLQTSLEDGGVPWRACTCRRSESAKHARRAGGRRGVWGAARCGEPASGGAPPGGRQPRVRQHARAPLPRAGALLFALLGPAQIGFRLCRGQWMSAPSAPTCSGASASPICACPLVHVVQAARFRYLQGETLAQQAPDTQTAADHHLTHIPCFRIWLSCTVLSTPLCVPLRMRRRRR